MSNHIAIRQTLHSLASFSILALLCTSAQAQFTWTGLGGNNDWGNAGNWNSPLAPPPGSSVTFVGPVNNVVDLGSNRTVGELTFNATIPFTLLNNSLLINSGVTTSGSIAGAHDLFSDVSITSLINWNIGEDAPLEVIGDVSGAGGIVKQGGGDLFLTGANSYTGGTVFEQGIVSVEDDANLGATTGSLTFDGGDLRWDAQFDLDPSRAITLNAGSGTLRTRTFNTTISQAITGVGGLTKAGSGTLTLDGVNTYTGDTNIDNGSVVLGVFDALKTSVVNINVDDGLDINGLDAEIKGLAGAGDLDLGSQELQVGFGGATSDYSGVITGGAGSRLRKRGSGTLTLTGGTVGVPMAFDSLRADAGTIVLDGVHLELNSNQDYINGPLTTFGGDIVIQNGSDVHVTNTGSLSSIEDGSLTVTGNGTQLQVDQSIRVGDVETLPGSVLVDDGATFNLAGNFVVGDDDQGDLTVQGGGNVSAPAVAFGRDDTGASDSLITGAGSSLMTGQLGLGGLQDTGQGFGGTGALTVTDSAAAVVDGATTFWTSSSSLTVDGGTYSTDTLAEHTGVAGTISLSDPVDDVAFTVGAGDGDSTFAGLIQDAGGGPGSLKKVGAGTLTLDGANTYTGDTIIDGGSIILGDTNALQDSTVQINVDNGLNVNGLDAQLGALSGDGDLNIGSQDIQVGFNDASTTYSGVITGTIDSLLLRQGDGTLTLTGGTETTPSVFGTLRSQQNGGAIDVDGAHIELTAVDGGVNNGALRAASGDIRLLNGAKVSLDVADGDALARNALLQISGAGTTLTAHRLDIDSGGAVLVEDGALLDVQFYNVAWLGNGELVVQSGANVDVDSDLAIGVTSGDLGDVVVSGDGSLLSADSLRLGGRTNGTNGGVGELTVEQGGSVQVASHTTFYTSASTIVIDGGKMSTDTLVEFTGVTGTISLSDSVDDVALTIGTGDGDSSFSGLIQDAGGGPGSLKKVGAGTLTLDGANTYTGDTIIDGGSIILGDTNALQDSTVQINVDNGLNVNGLDAQLGALSGDGDLNIGSQDIQVGFNDASTTYSGVITGTIDSLLLRQGDGTLTLTGGTETTPSVFGTLRSQQNGGAIDVDGAHIELTAVDGGVNNGALRAASGDIRLLNGAKVSLDVADGDALARNALLQISGAGTTLTAHRLDIDSGGAVLVEDGALLDVQFYNVAWLGNGELVVQSGANVDVDSDLAIGVTSGDLGDVVVSGDGSLLSADSLRLGGRTNGTNGGVGELTVEQGGSVQVASHTTFYTSASTIVIDGGKMSTDTLVEFTGVTGTISLSDPVDDVAFTVGTDDGDSTFAGLIQDAGGGPGSLKKVGTGTLTLAGANTYTGDTIVEGGVLSLAQDYLADAANVVLDATATLDLTHAATDTIDQLILGGFSRGMGTHGAIGSGADFEWAQITGTGLLMVSSTEGVLGDFDFDGDVDGTDLLVWQREDGTAQGLADWKANYGFPSPPVLTAVPEPSAAVLTLIGIALPCRIRRR